MSLPVHIPASAPGIRVMNEARKGGMKYSLLVDAEGGPSTDLSQGIFFLGAGHTEALHRHDIVETMYILEGTGHALLSDQKIDLAPGDTLFIPAGQPHGFVAETDMKMLFTFPVPRFSDVTYHFENAA
ncbi:cupin domain-containing protein [Pseudooctadecabacter sp.]|uniref:cupin domain-containing protein n=1 Tax=Pseudooctadecabacter sp. TaxID=1966338 RepID=UPI0035C7E7F7